MILVIENSIYSLFIYLLIKKKWKENIFVLDKGAYNDKIKEKVKICYYYRDLNLKKNFFKYYKEKIMFLIFLVKNKIIFDKNLKIYGDDILLKLFFMNKEFYMIEDGTWTYQIKKEDFFVKRIIKRLIKLEDPFYIESGLDKRVKKVYLTGLAPTPKEIKNKVEIINLKKLWNEKTKEEQEEILDIFDFNYEIIEILKKRKNILFTQPLYEDGTLTEEEKIEIYRKILKNYDEKDVVIKIHPRETTNYKKVFPNVVVLEQKFPSELLNVLDIKFEKAITIFSTAACTLDKNIEVDFYGTEIHNKILKRFGCQSHIYKTNCFIK